MTSQLLTRPTRPQVHCPACLDPARLFDHDCPNDPRFGAPLALASTRRSDSIDPPERHGAGSGAGHFEGATEAQVRYLVKLGMESAEANRLSKAHASKAIDRLVAERKAQAMQPASTPAAGGRRNKYASACRLCQHEVGAEQGWLVRMDGRWLVEHDGCPSADGPPAPVATKADVQAALVPAGHYAIPSTGDNDLVFYRVDRPTKGTYAGRTFVKMVVGGHPDQNVRRDHMAGVLARIAEAGPAEAARLYGTELGQCSRCNRHLTDETSRALGIGPECRSK